MFLPVFHFIPVRDNFKDVHYKAVTLRAPPTLARTFFVLEVIFTIIIFILSYYYSANTSTEVTTISFEVLGDGYTCTLLSPRSDSYEYSTDTSELVQFSDARLGLSECKNYLGSKGYDVCNENRNDYVLTLDGVGADDSEDYDCHDILLAHGHRFCYGKAQTYYKDLPSMSKSFYVQSNPHTTEYISEMFYFMNSSTHVYGINANIDYQSVYTDYITDLNDNVYVIAKNSHTQRIQLFRLHPGLSEAETLTEFASSNVYGMTYGAHALFIYFIEQGNARIVKYDLRTKVTTTVNAGCTSVTNSPSGSTARFMSYGDDNYIYFLCNDQTVVGNTAPFRRTLSVSRVNASSIGSTIQTFSADVTNMNYTDTSGATTTNTISKYDSVFVLSNKLYLIAIGEYSNVLRGNFNLPGSTNINGFTNRGSFTGFSAVRDNNKRLYFPNGNFGYYDALTGQFGNYSQSTFRGNFYHPLTVQLGYAYQICNHNYTDYVVDGSSSSSFRKKCWQKNGFYYQTNEYMDVPASCQGSMQKKTDISSLLSCPAMQTLQSTFQAKCTGSYDKICDQEYTQNPPFSCTEETYPTTLTNLSTAFANGSAAFSFMVILSRLLCKILYPHGVLEFDYDEEHERYLPPGTISEKQKGKDNDGKIHPVREPVDRYDSGIDPGAARHQY